MNDLDTVGFVDMIPMTRFLVRIARSASAPSIVAARYRASKMNTENSLLGQESKISCTITLLIKRSDPCRCL